LSIRCSPYLPRPVRFPPKADIGQSARAVSVSLPRDAKLVVQNGAMKIAFYDAAQVEELLDYPGCIDAMRQAMIALSSGERPQPLRQIFTVGNNDMFGTMPGELAALSTFGAKLVSVFADPQRPGRTRHQGVVVAYDGVTGAVSCIADAEPVTMIRTACATAAATDALARKDAEVLAIFGTGVQAESHLRAVTLVRPFREVLLWGRSADRTREFAA